MIWACPFAARCGDCSGSHLRNFCATQQACADRHFHTVILAGH
jgi:hypothetical protein